MIFGRAARVGAALGLWVVAALLVSSSTVAHAQAAGDDPVVGYHAAIDQAIAEYAAGNFSEARALFYRAHRIYPNARTLRGIGMVEFELKRYGVSIAFLQQALESTVRPLDADLRVQTEALLARAKGFVARYELRVRPAPASASARITVDGVPLDLQRGRELVLTVGEHALEVRAEGYRDEKRVLSVKGGEYHVLTVDLRVVQSAPALATGDVAAKDDGSVWGSPWLWTGVVAVVAGGVVTALLVTAAGDDAKLEPGDVGGVVETLRSAP